MNGSRWQRWAGLVAASSLTGCARSEAPPYPEWGAPAATVSTPQETGSSMAPPTGGSTPAPGAVAGHPPGAAGSSTSTVDRGGARTDTPPSGAEGPRDGGRSEGGAPSSETGGSAGTEQNPAACDHEWTGRDCDRCPDDEVLGHWDPDQDCSACLPGYSGDDCLTCSFPLDSYAARESITLTAIPAGASGIAWSPETETFFVVANKEGQIWEYDATLEEVVRTIALSDSFADAEGLAQLDDGRLAVVLETNWIYVAHVDGNTRRIDLEDDTVRAFQPIPAPAEENAGLEGIAYRHPRGSDPGRIYVCQEHLPMRVLAFDVIRGAAQNPRSYADGTLEVYEPWDAEQAFAGEVTDIAGLEYDGASDTLLVVSQESSRVLRVEPETGHILERLELEGTTTAEGLALFRDCQLAVVSEPNELELLQGS